MVSAVGESYGCGTGGRGSGTVLTRYSDCLSVLQVAHSGSGDEAADGNVGVSWGGSVG